MQSSRVYPPREEKTGTPAGALSGEVDKWTRANDMRTLMNMKNKAAREREIYGKAAEYKKAEHLENLKAQYQKELAELKARLTVKYGAKGKRFKDPDMLEQFMLTKGHFPAAMKAKKTPKGTDNPFAEYTPEDEAKHIAALAQMRGFVPDAVQETAAGHEGGFMGIGGKDTPAQVFQTYKPGPNAGGGSVEIAEPQPQEEPAQE